MKRYLAAVSSVAVLGLTGLAGTAPAQTTQNGLVNVNLADNTIQVPISVAANICQVPIAILAAQRQTGGTTDCTAVSNATASSSTVGAPTPSATTQTGLVNVNVTGNTVQVPIAAAVNVCDVSAAVLAVQLLTNNTATCDARSTSHAGP